MLLSTTDFEDRPYKVPNQEESADFEAFIEQAEKDVLIELLGYEFYTLMIDEYETSGAIDPIYEDLVEGAEYDYDGITYKWNGMIHLLQPIVYAKWMDAGSYKFTNIGWIQNSAQQNSVSLDSEQFKAQYLNEFAKKAGINRDMYNTLYGFMEVNSDDYPLAVWTDPKTFNRFGV